MALLYSWGIQALTHKLSVSPFGETTGQGDKTVPSWGRSVAGKVKFSVSLFSEFNIRFWFLSSFLPSLFFFLCFFLSSFYSSGVLDIFANLPELYKDILVHG